MKTNNSNLRVTIEEAASKYCPFTLTCDGGTSRCITTNCLAFHLTDMEIVVVDNLVENDRITKLSMMRNQTVQKTSTGIDSDNMLVLPKLFTCLRLK